MDSDPFQFSLEPTPRPGPLIDHHSEGASCLGIHVAGRGIEIGEELERKGVKRQRPMVYGVRQRNAARLDLQNLDLPSAAGGSRFACAASDLMRLGIEMPFFCCSSTLFLCQLKLGPPL